MSKKSLIAEFKDRGVFRVAGFYIALAWLSLQIADVIFPAFDIPDSVLRYILYVAAAGLPVVCILAWFFEITKDGIVSETEIADGGANRSKSNGLTIATITTLALALGTSLYLNFRFVSEVPVTAPSLKRILIADFNNSTGDELFDGSLESALAIGIEGAPFVSSFSRDDASRTASKIKPNAPLDEETARLVSLREGVDLVLAGSISGTGNRYQLRQRLINPVNGEEVAAAEAEAEGKAAVLPAVGSLAAQIREALGDTTLENGNLAEHETLTTSSLVAVQHYTKAQTFAFREQNEEAVEFFEKAVTEDPDFGRAYTGWALSALKLGRREKASELWEKALAKLGSSSERERFRTLGVYYAMVAGNQRKAIESYESLVEKYPADTIGYNNLGVTYFLAREFDKALEVGELITQRFPTNPAFRTNYALYAMYAGDFSVAEKEAQAVIAEEPDYFLAYLPLAMAHSHAGAFDIATEQFNKMERLNARAKSIAIMGKADISMIKGDYVQAIAELKRGIQVDRASKNSNGASHKSVQLARALFAEQQTDSALETLDAQAAIDGPLSQALPAALLYVDLDVQDKAKEFATALGESLQSEKRAAANLINGALALANGEHVTAVDALRESIAQTDTWLGRFYLGRTYAEAGYNAEALGEFETCLERIGETTALFLDDIPSFHYHRDLSDWLTNTRLALGMSPETPRPTANSR